MEDRYKVRIWDENEEEMLGPIAVDGPPDTITMQCTALKDRNGELIYEGDILKNIYSGRKYTIKYEKYTIKYGECNLIIAGPDGINKLSEIPLHSNYEVIGNIYENPELLDGEK